MSLNLTKVQLGKCVCLLGLRECQPTDFVGQQSPTVTERNDSSQRFNRSEGVGGQSGASIGRGGNRQEEGFPSGIGSEAHSGKKKTSQEEFSLLLVLRLQQLRKSGKLSTKKFLYGKFRRRYKFSLAFS